MEHDLNKPQSTTSTSRKLRRSTQGRLIAGVCSGVGEYAGVDPTVIRLLLGVFTLFGGSGVILYVLGWLLIPEAGSDVSLAQELIDKNKDNPKVQEMVNKTKEAFTKSGTGRS
ncbi:PspC domain-containing protein [Thermomonospora catenispora]|uniref:PspC domain-containing protein n=1 Tax=Thermomonospora catenispora TaxID=2493090 RepID=UPI00112423BD|nr:PspC domain-containing protein [Thermomonospora catenispora]TNY36585.1 PspC domain-containing protein [Thermomonospora catenispora]